MLRLWLGLGHKFYILEGGFCILCIHVRIYMYLLVQGVLCSYLFLTEFAGKCVQVCSDAGASAAGRRNWSGQNCHCQLPCSHHWQGYNVSIASSDVSITSLEGRITCYRQYIKFFSIIYYFVREHSVWLNHPESPQCNGLSHLKNSYCMGQTWYTNKSL